MSTFSDFKKDFYSRVPDLSLFDCADVNLLKVVLDGLRVDYSNKKKLKHDFLLPAYQYRIKFFLKQFLVFLKGKKGNYIQKQFAGRVLIGFSERVYPSGGTSKSIYFENLFQIIGKDNVVFVGESKKNELDGTVDYKLQELIKTYSLKSLKNEEEDFRTSLQQTYYAVSDSNIFHSEDLYSIASAFEVFFIHYKSWNKILKDMKPPVVVFDQHYHREGFILACKRNRIKTVELQHGLIVPEDIFYIFPQCSKGVINKALFADEICVYGEYWKDNLLKGVEYGKDQIRIIGFYHYEPVVDIEDSELINFIGSENVILITTQVNLSDLYCDYIIKLSKLLIDKSYNWKVLIKIHPSEKLEDYAAVGSLINCRLVQYPLNYLFTLSKIHISIYSTTLFDSHRFNICNFTLNNEKCKDYCARIAEDNIAQLIEASDDPVVFYNKMSSKDVVSDYLYKRFDENELLTLLNV